ncbi:hypothetical protein ID866_6823 [Astraeus odoratus]|nr:hypothetical protein ID866_6823 [Astraeus odoratus]
MTFKHDTLQLGNDDQLANSDQPLLHLLSRVRSYVRCHSCLTSYHHSYTHGGLMTLNFTLYSLHMTEAPDLGAFTSVFREFQHLHTGPPRILFTSVIPGDDVGTVSSPRSALLTTSVVDTPDSETNAGSTVWNQGIVASYLHSHTPSALSQGTSDDRSPVVVDNTTDYDNEHSLDDTDSFHNPPQVGESESETEGEPDIPTLVIGSVESGDIVVDPDHPTLGTIDSVIEFLNAERDRVQAGRQVEPKMFHYSSPSDTGAHRNRDSDARRSRRRRRKKPLKPFQILQRAKDVSETVSETTTTTVLAEDTSGDADRDDLLAPDQDPDSSSSFEGAPTHYRSTPSTPPRAKPTSLVRDKLKHSRSTPALQLQTIPPDPQVLQLRCLAHKLRLKFPEDYDRITALLTQDFSGVESDFSDPRGPPPRPRDTLIHVFIDHSNILIGLLTYHKKHRSAPRRPKRLSHAALALLLERGRPITRRCLVTSSPLYQPMDTAEQLGYEVRIYARVPDDGNGQNKRPNHGHSHTPDPITSRSANIRKSEAGPSMGHARGNSVGSDSDPTSSRVGSSARPSGATSARVRYREQGVDELLQLKLHQAIADVDVPPPSATIVLATGDGNVGQFNDEGFLGPVRTALKKGWKVELYAWEEGLSRAWRREFAEGPYKDRFRIIKMEDFADDLLEVDVEAK